VIPTHVGSRSPAEDFFCLDRAQHTYSVTFELHVSDAFGIGSGEYEFDLIL
jgi:hypothetical protein